MFVLDTSVISELMSDGPWLAVLVWVDEQRVSDRQTMGTQTTDQTIRKSRVQVTQSYLLIKI